jgi:hypothetical protein
VEQEHSFGAEIRLVHPLVETYIQNLGVDKSANITPVSDEYFLGRLDFSNGREDRSFMRNPDFSHRLLARMSEPFATRFHALGFAYMVMLDDDLGKKYYDFKFVRREFLGEVRCLLIEVRPRVRSGNGRFKGRIWVEDRDYHIVRFNGVYSPPPHHGYYPHFDGWRLNMRPNLWLPAYVYSEESDPKSWARHSLHFKAQTRFWGYGLQSAERSGEFTQIQVDPGQSVLDRSATANDATPLQAVRAWERQAEDNIVERLQNAGLLAPAGAVDTVLQTVVNNLIVTNNLDIQPDVRCRELITSPLESFTIGHTIVVSRGLLDVLPDEVSLAAILAHELAHVALGHTLDTRYAFSDRLLFGDQSAFGQLHLAHNSSDEEAADRMGLEMLAHSPYKDKVSEAGLFLEALRTRASGLKYLVKPHLGNSVMNQKTTKMSPLLSLAPKLEMQRLDQIAALPLGGRIRLDPWNDQLDLTKTTPVTLLSARDKLMFEVTPFFPYLTRFSNSRPDKIASAPTTK